MITDERKYRGNTKKPQPGTLEFDLCEALAKDGFLDRDLRMGTYRLKSSAAENRPFL